MRGVQPDFAGPGFAVKLQKDIVTSGLQAIFNWIDAIQGNRIYSICLAQAKLNWKSPLQLALLGI